MEDVGVSVSLIWRKAYRLPKPDTPRRGIDRDHFARPRTRQQRQYQLPPNTDAAKHWPDVEPAHPKSSGYDRVDGQTADTGEHSVYERGEQCLTIAIKARRVRVPIGREPFHLPKAFGARLSPQNVEAVRQIFDDSLRSDFHTSLSRAPPQPSPGPRAPTPSTPSPTQPDLARYRAGDDGGKVKRWLPPPTALVGGRGDSGSEQRGAALAELGGLLEGVGDAQQGRLLERLAGQLDS